MIPALLTVLLPGFGSAAPRAHDEKVSESRIRVSDDAVVWSVHVALSRLEPVVSLPAEPIDLGEKELQSVKGEIARYLRGGLSLEINGRLVEPQIGALVPDYAAFIATGVPYIAFVTQEYHFRAPREVKLLRLGIRLFADQMPNHQALVKVEWGDRRAEYVRVGPSELVLTYARLDPDYGDPGGFFLGGAHDFLFGYRAAGLSPFPAIVFLVALLILARSAGEAARIGAAFFAASGASLGVAGLNKEIALSPPVTSILLAASIVYVAVENWFLKEGRYRWLTALVFGLVFGQAYLAALRHRLIDFKESPVPVLAFIAGVALGGAALLLVAHPLISWLRPRPQGEDGASREQRFVRVGSCAALLLGAGWLVEQLFHVRFMPL